MVKNIFFLMTILLTLASCSGKKGSASVNLKIIAGNTATGDSIVFLGGAILYGKSEDGKSSFRTGLDASSGSLSMNLPKGRWDFYVIAWAGNDGNFTGTNRCGFSNVDLKNDEMNVAFDLASSNCLQVYKGKEFAATGHTNPNGVFNLFKFSMCLNNTPGDANCYYSENNSTLTSYRVFYRGDKKGEVTGNVDPLISECYSFTSWPLYLKLPFTNAGNGSPFGMSVALYKDTNCLGVPDAAYDFSDGFINSGVQAFNATDVIAGYYSFLYLNPGDRFNTTLLAEPIDLHLINTTTVGTGDVVLPTSYLEFSTSVPTYAQEMCAKLVGAGSCNASDWIPASGSGRISMLGMDAGNYELAISFRTAAGVVSSVIGRAFILDTSAPTTPGLTGYISSGYVFATWSVSDTLLFKQVHYDLCGDSTCTDIRYSGTSTSLNSNASNNLTVNSFTGSGTVYFRIVVEDELGRLSTPVVIAKAY